jgi:hypothetical protein
MPTGTRAEFAAHRGVHKSTVSRWEKAGRMAFDADGKVDFEKSIELIDQSADPAKQGVVIRHARERENKVIEVALFASEKAPPPEARQTPPGGSELPGGAGGNADSTYAEFNRARADKESELAKLAKIKREEQESLLIRREKVKRDIESLAAVVSKGLGGISARVMPLINGEPDAAKRELILEEEVRKVLTDFANAAVTLDDAGELVSDA